MVINVMLNKSYNFFKKNFWTVVHVTRQNANSTHHYLKFLFFYCVTIITLFYPIMTPFCQKQYVFVINVLFGFCLSALS